VEGRGARTEGRVSPVAEDYKSVQAACPRKKSAPRKLKKVSLKKKQSVVGLNLALLIS